MITRALPLNHSTKGGTMRARTHMLILLDARYHTPPNLSTKHMGFIGKMHKNHFSKHKSPAPLAITAFQRTGNSLLPAKWT